MQIVTFCDFDEKLLNGYEYCYYMSGCNGKADVAILDIHSIFDYEEKKLGLVKDDYMSVAIIDDPSDFDAFKNFGITAWIKREELAQLPNLLKEIEQRRK
jgi:hypothetical protein